MDLRNFGIQITLTKGMNLEPYLQQKNVRVGYFSKHRSLLVLPSGRYSVGAFLGSGSYSTIYLATHETTNISYSIKLIPVKKTTFESVIREAIIHILLAKESVNESHGPYVPRFYEIAYDSYNDLMILRTETIQDILYDRFRAGTREENDNIVPHAIAQIAYILDFFYKRLGFNHRDCKPNNILYNYDPTTGKFDIKLIDFGLSCLSWNGISIHAGDRFGGAACYRPSRDLTQFLYATYTDRSIPLSERLRGTMRECLTFPVDGKVCRMYEGCHAYGNPMEVWAHSYRFMNDRRVENPHTVPRVLKRRMLDYLGMPAKGVVDRRSIVGLPHCVPERVLNPRTRRCVLRASAEGRRVLRLSKRYSTPSPKTLRKYRDSRNRNHTTKAKGSRKGQGQFHL
jgi:serine/threonine protein kinase